VFSPLVDSLINEDRFLALADYQSYVDTQDRVEAAFRDPRAWTRSAVLNVARCGYFSSDRSIQDYIDRIWNVAPVDAR
jgi:glycogen phosphorylase